MCVCWLDRGKRDVKQCKVGLVAPTTKHTHTHTHMDTHTHTHRHNDIQSCGTRCCSISMCAQPEVQWGSPRVRSTWTAAVAPSRCFDNGEKGGKPSTVTNRKRSRSLIITLSELTCAQVPAVVQVAGKTNNNRLPQSKPLPPTKNLTLCTQFAGLGLSLNTKANANADASGMSSQYSTHTHTHTHNHTHTEAKTDKINNDFGTSRSCCTHVDIQGSRTGQCFQPPEVSTASHSN